MNRAGFLVIPRAAAAASASSRRSSYDDNALLLSGLGLIFLIAFVSYHVQFPGLVSSAGIEPAGRIFPLAFPRIYDKLFSFDRQQQLEEDNMLSLLWVKVDLICETCCIIGIVLSIVVASGFIHHGGLIMFITLLYYVLVQLGGVFYSFQWDTLLLETGFVVSLCSAPWLSSHYCHYTSSSNTSNITTTSNTNKEVGRWPVRFLLFKLMFMSGVVKIQSDCPTWKHLTALEYHFATQCLPGPLAWYAHQMHPLLLRFGVAMTFLIEIPGAFLLICWNCKFRQVGAWMQILLQVMIIVTGNYNFFNVLTMLLCVSCLVDVVVEPETVELPEEKEKESNRRRRRRDLHLCFGFIAWIFSNMFEIKYYLPVTAEDDNDQLHHLQHQRKEMTINLKWTKEFCESMIEKTVPIVICYVLLYMVSFLPEILALPNKQRKWMSLIDLLVCFLCIGISSVPFMNLSPRLRDVDNWTMLPAQMFVKPWNYIQPFHFSNGYGLFRRMTGVGRRRIKSSDGSAALNGWGGFLEPSVVERPEVIFKGIFLPKGTSRELHFRWKPGDVTKRPKQVAPHQPRLDWQMWFAALGTYQHNPWLIHLMHKLLQGCRPVIELLDEPLLAKGDEKLVSIESLLYHYDFTSYSSYGARNDTNDYNHDDGQAPTRAGDWWVRSGPIREYVPKLSRDDPSLKQYLKTYGYRNNMCFSPSDKCKVLQPGSTSLKICRWIAAIRNFKN